ncbi:MULTISPECIES: YjgN family protein [unclassified Sphingomonas]|uniref:YjgN family protein n=1 Tax=unclassified Sphingomonas TaxID=196159 RepID=UPI00045127E7|nr:MULTISPECIES: YjgN family protein [unclassified Sphingomonas]EZP52549.1 Membrane-like protein [Sphingomonas sp. RIT328]
MSDPSAAPVRAFRFTGRWQDYAPIAFTNLLLTIVTLGIYTFWGRARTRRYLWSRTRFIDDRLEYTGTGLELFLGYVIAFFVIVLPFGIVNLAIQGTLMRGHQGAAAVTGMIVYLAILYLVGVARFRALRYRLSRTYWHGIRGGSSQAGLGYGWRYFWQTIVATFTVYLLMPWSMVRLWNQRWNAMSFGSLPFRSHARWQPVFGRFLLFYLLPVILFGAVALLVAAIGFSGGFDGPRSTVPSPGMVLAIALGGLAFYIVFFGVLGLIAMTFYAAFFREAVGATSLGSLDFGFEATTRDWILLYLGNLALVVVTFGIGAIFLQYRNWAFFIRHLNAYGEIAVDDLLQSRERAPGQGEGLLDAFDVGAF